MLAFPLLRIVSVLVTALLFGNVLAVPSKNLMLRGMPCSDFYVKQSEPGKCPDPIDLDEVAEHSIAIYKSICAPDSSLSTTVTSESVGTYKYQDAFVRRRLLCGTSYCDINPRVCVIMGCGGGRRLSSPEMSLSGTTVLLEANVGNGTNPQGMKIAGMSSHSVSDSCDLGELTLVIEM